MAAGEADFDRLPGRSTTPDKVTVDRPVDHEKPRVETLQSVDRIQ